MKDNKRIRIQWFEGSSYRKEGLQYYMYICCFDILFVSKWGVETLSWEHQTFTTFTKKKSWGKGRIIKARNVFLKKIII